MSTGNRLPKDGIGADSCALCGLFFKNGCEGCPIAEKTKQIKCRETPYYNVWLSWNIYGIDSKEFKQAAKEELKFLQSLLLKTTNKTK